MMFGASNTNSTSSTSTCWVKQLNPNFQTFLSSSTSSTSSSSSSSSYYASSTSQSMWPPFGSTDPYLLHPTTLTDHTAPGTTAFFQETSRPPFALFGSLSAASPTHPLTASAKAHAKKDRHSKICTAQGVRDRRVRLSIGIAREFFDLQDMLGFDKASKTLEWLLTKSKKAIKEVAKAKKLQPSRRSAGSSSAMAGGLSVPEGEEEDDDEEEEQEGEEEVEEEAAGYHESKESSSDLTNSREEIPQEQVVNIHQLFQQEDRRRANAAIAVVRANDEVCEISAGRSIKAINNYRCTSPNYKGVALYPSIRDHSNSTSSGHHLLKPSQYQQFQHSPSAPRDDLPRSLSSEDDSSGFPLLPQYCDIYYNSLISQQPSTFGEPYI